MRLSHAPLLTLAIMLLLPATVARAVPKLYAEPFRQSPVQGEPNDLLLLAGSGLAQGDQVVYTRLTNTTITPTHPSLRPTTSNSSQGLAAVVSYANTPNSLSVRLQAVMSPGQAYALWVVNASNEWSNPVKINDARPLWISPETVYRTAQLASLPRELKVVGRNMQRTTFAATKVRLVGPTGYTLTAANDGSSTTSIERYVARVSLPSTLQVGAYSVQVSRDGTSWTTVAGQQLQVLPDPVAPPSFAVAGCSPNDGLDDTACILDAIKRAAAAGGGTVTLGAGTWDMQNAGLPGVNPTNGIVLPVAVNLQGAGRDSTTLLKAANWTAPTGFSVLGKNIVSGIKFRDLYPPGPCRPGASFPAHVQLSAQSNAGPPPVDNVTLAQNEFQGDCYAVSTLARAAHLVIYGNKMGGYNGGLYLPGDPNDRVNSHIDDSIIANNTFIPGGAYASVASQIGMSRRLDFSGNEAGGKPADRVYGPTGWGAVFFFHMHSNHEMLLISQNAPISCTQDGGGNGEGIVFDPNGNVTGFKQAQTALSATSTTVTVAGPMQKTSAGYYQEHWLQIAAGTGLGQARKIISYTDPSATQVSFTVSPAWDVVPAQDSLVTVTRQAWHAYVVDNQIDGNGCSVHAGSISLQGMATDSVVDGNSINEARDIALVSGYSAYSANPDDVTSFYQNFQYFVDMQNNSVSSCDANGFAYVDGVAVLFNAQIDAVGAGTSPVTNNYGIRLGSNRITGANKQGAVLLTNNSLAQTNARHSQSPLIYANTLSGVTRCNSASSTGIKIAPYVWGAALSGNTIQNQPVPVDNQSH